MDSRLSYKLELIDLVWGPIPQRRMNPLAVIKPLNVVENALPCLGTGLIVAVKNESSFQQPEKTLSWGIVPAVAFSAHTANCAVFYQQALEISACILRSPVRMMNQARWGLRRFTARVKASMTRLRVMRSDIDHPTTAREKRSMTTARYSHPSFVHM